MDSNLASYLLQYAGYLLEGSLVCYLVWSSQWKRQRATAFYVSCLLVAELSRVYALQRFGLRSTQYLTVYWTTDFLLVISLFILVCLFFRRACSHEEKMWRFVRLLLVFVGVLVVGISGLTFSHNYNHLFLRFVTEFNQNLYFTCLVLNTLLYLLLQQIESTDEQLGLLVCGVGIQFAGPAATLALLHLTDHEHFAQSLGPSFIRLCTLAMLLVWAYAITRIKESPIQVSGGKNPVLAEVIAD